MLCDDLERVEVAELILNSFMKILPAVFIIVNLSLCLTSRCVYFHKSATLYFRLQRLDRARVCWEQITEQFIARAMVEYLQ